MCSPSAQGNGGGLAIYGTATLINSAIYQNKAPVGARLLNRNRLLLQRPAGTLHVLAFMAQGECGYDTTGDWVCGVAARILNPP